MKEIPLWITQLEADEVQFVKRFLLASGSLKEMADIYGVTYPTVRNRLDHIIRKVKLSEEGMEDPYVSLIKKMAMEGKKVAGVTCDSNTAVIEVKGTDICALPSILKLFAENGITSDMMTGIDGRLGITVPRSKIKQARKVLCEYGFETEKISVDANVAKVSVVGCGLGGDPNVAANMLNSIKEEGVDVKSVVAGEIRISALVPDIYADIAVRAIHKAFFEK